MKIFLNRFRNAAASQVFVFAASLVFVTAPVAMMTGCSKKPDAPSVPVAPPPPPLPPPPPPPPPPPAAVGGVSLGKSIGADKKITAAGDSFGVKDTIYASVETTGVGKAVVLKAKWTFTDKKGKAIPVNEESMNVDLNGPATHEFHITKKSPWPKGAYDVEVFLSDASVAKKTFSVK